MKIIVPVIFHAPVTVSSGPRSILTFVEVAIPFRRLSEEDAPLAISRTVNHDVVRNFRVYDGTLYAATTRLSEFRSESDQILESVSSIERNLAREAAAELQMEFAQDIAEKAGVSVEMRNPAEYLLPHDRLPGVDMRYPEPARAAKNVAFAVGTEITRRLKNQELAVFDDDSTIRYAFDRLHDVIRTVDPFGAPDSRVETALVELLEALRDDPAKTKAVYRNMLDHHSEILDHADTVLRLWDERPMDIDITKAQAPGMRQ